MFWVEQEEDIHPKLTKETSAKRPRSAAYTSGLPDKITEKKPNSARKKPNQAKKN